MRSIPMIVAVLPLLSCACERREELAARHEREGEDEHPEGVVKLSEVAMANVRVRAEEVRRQRLSGLISTTGTVDFDPDRVLHVAARLPGRLHETRVALGDHVQPGDVLAVIDSVELGRLKSEYLQAKARLELAARNLEREEKLAAQRITSEQAVLTAKADVLELQASLRAAEATLRLSGLTQSDVERLDYGAASMALYTLRAPFAATVIDKHLTRGELVSPDKDVMTLVDLSRVWVWIDVYERDAADVHVGDGARIYADALGGRVLTGTVTFIRPQVDPKTRRIGARVEVANPGEALKQGMFVKVELRDPHGSGGPEALVVPESALLRDGAAELVFVEVEPRHFLRKQVRVGRRAEGHVELVEGLAEGERIVVEGAPILKAELSKASMGGGHGH